MYKILRDCLMHLPNTRILYASSSTGSTESMGKLAYALSKKAMEMIAMSMDILGMRFDSHSV